MQDQALTEAQIQRFAAMLAGLELELGSELDKTDDQAQPVDVGAPIGRLSRMDAIQHQQMSQATRKQQRLRLTRVRRALDAITRGEYGLCRVCEENIDRRRLEVRPESIMCLPCSKASERSTSA